MPAIKFVDVGLKEDAVSDNTVQRCNRAPAVYVQSDKSGCTSFVGQLERPSQTLNLGSGCESLGARAWLVHTWLLHIRPPTLPRTLPHAPPQGYWAA